MYRVIKGSSNQWPPVMTYNEYEEGDQLIDCWLTACANQKVYAEPSGQAGIGTDYFYCEESGEELGSVDFDEEDRALNRIFNSSVSEEDCIQKMEQYLQSICN